MFLNELNDGAVLISIGRRFHLWMIRYEKNDWRCLNPFVASSFTSRVPLLAELPWVNSGETFQDFDTEDMVQE